MSCRKLKVLFVGNSYTFFHDMPTGAFREIANAAGYEVEVSTVTCGGYRLCQFADPADAYGIRLRQTVAGQHYDYAVLQEQSLNPIRKEEEFLRGAADVAALIPAERFVMYATWGRNDGSEDLRALGMDRVEMTEKLNAAYHKAADLIGARVAEVGNAFLEYAKDHNKDDLYHPDKSHPSAIGSEVAAGVIFAEMAKEKEQT